MPITIKKNTPKARAAFFHEHAERAKIESENRRDTQFWGNVETTYWAELAKILKAHAKNIESGKV